MGKRALPKKVSKLPIEITGNGPDKLKVLPLEPNQSRIQLFGGPMPRKILRPLKQGKLSCGFKKRMILESVPTKIENLMKMRNNLIQMQKIQQFSKKMIKEYEDA